MTSHPLVTEVFLTTMLAKMLAKSYYKFQCDSWDSYLGILLTNPKDNQSLRNYLLETNGCLYKIS